MSSKSTHQFPSPVGGVPYPIDFVPSILFSALHGLLLPIIIWRMWQPRSRTFVLVGTAVFTLERVIAFALRAAAANDKGLRENETLETYFQTTLSDGFISIGQGITHLSRALLVDATMGSRAHHALSVPMRSSSMTHGGVGNDIPFSTRRDSLHDVSPVSFVEEVDLEDHPRQRAWIRRIWGVGSLSFWGAVVLSTIAGLDYQNAIDSGAHADIVSQLWYASTSLVILLLFNLILGVLWAMFKVPRIVKGSAALVIFIACLLFIVTIYRLVVMQYSTTTLYSTAPGSQNAVGSKVAFYICHVAPEFIASAILMSINAREMFAAGFWGDQRYRDPKPAV